MNAVVCPECGEEYSPQGLYGHLMGHGLAGEEVEQAYQQALDGGRGGDGDSEQPSEESFKLPAIGGDGSGESSGGTAEESAEQVSEPEEKTVNDPADPGEQELPDLPSRGVSGHRGRSREERDPSRTTAEEVEKAFDRLCRARQRLREAEENTGEKIEETVQKGGFVSSLLGRNLLGKTETRETIERTKAEKELLERYREEVEKAEEEYQRLKSKRQAEHEYGEA